MPANLTQQYLKVEEKYRLARSDEEKLITSQELLTLLPKHKGTEKIQAELKKRISSLRKSCEKKEKKITNYVVDKNGFPQVVVIGSPNSGKSQLISILAGIQLEVQNYPFTTRVPAPAIMSFEDIKFQLVDTPPIASTHMDTWMPSVIRAADAILWTIDYSNDQVLEDTQVIEEKLKQQKICLAYAGKKDLRAKNCFVKNTLLVATKSDLPEVAENIAIMKDLFHCDFSPVSSKDNLKELKKSLFQVLDLIRIYPKPPGQKADMENPILLPTGSSIIDFAAKIHHDLAKKVKSARIWNSGTHSDGVNIPRHSILEDKNIVELTK